MRKGMTTELVPGKARASRGVDRDVLIGWQIDFLGGTAMNRKYGNMSP